MTNPTSPPVTAEQIEALVERLSLHSTWRDSHGELNDAPNEAAQLLRSLPRAVPQEQRRAWAELIARQFETDAVDAIEEGIARGLAMLKAHKPAVVGDGLAARLRDAAQHFADDEWALLHEAANAVEALTTPVGDEVVERDGDWLDLKDAPRDGTMIWLLMDYGAYGTCPLADARVAATIGFNSFDDTGEDVWKFVAWSWEQDNFHHHETDNHKITVPAGWRPIGFDLDQTPAGEGE